MASEVIDEYESAKQQFFTDKRQWNHKALRSYVKFELPPEEQ